MNNILDVTSEGQHIYNIHIENDYSKLVESLKDIDINRRVCIVTDSQVAPLYLEEVKEIYSSIATRVDFFIFEAGEESKQLSTVNKLYQKLIEEGYDRNDVLVALGGGVCGDMTGYVAATYLRGIRFIQMPTSLLAMVDSSVGGKTGVDFDNYKNMVGAFHQPALVYINVSTLNTLDDRQFSAGMAEVIKYGLIKNKDFYQWLGDNYKSVLNKDLDALKYIIYISCNTKREIVQRDPKEKGERALLNLGHTLGHSIEKQSDFNVLHGEGVSIGMLGALYISIMHGYLSQEDIDIYKDLCDKYNLPVRCHDCTKEDVVRLTENTKHDKKMDSGAIKFILVKEIGNAIIDKTVSIDEINNAFLELI